MAYSKYVNGFKISTASAIDQRFLLTKDRNNSKYLHMEDAEVSYLIPDKYFAMCVDDGKIYVYDHANQLLENVGRFRPIEDELDFTQSVEAQKNIEKAIEESEKIVNISSAVFTENNQNRIAILEKRVDDLSMDGGEVIE